MPTNKEKIDQDGFLATVFENSAQQFLHALALLNAYDGKREEPDPGVAQECLKNNPALADKIWSEICEHVFIGSNKIHEQIFNRPTTVDLINQIIKLAVFVKRHYHNKDEHEKVLDIDMSVQVLIKWKEKLEAGAQAQADKADQKLFDLAKSQQEALRIRTDLTPNIINKLRSTPPILPWEINNQYTEGPYRTRVEYNQYDSSVFVTLPLLNDLTREYPELIELAKRHPEPLPNQIDIQRKVIAWQQKLLKEDLSIAISAESRNNLLDNPPSLPWELNTENPSAPGWNRTQHRHGVNITIPLLTELTSKYQKLIKEAEKNPAPPPRTRSLTTSTTSSTMTTVTPAFDHAAAKKVKPSPAEKSSSEAYTGIDELIKKLKYEDIVDDIKLSGMFESIACPLSLCLMRDPVNLGVTGLVFERKAVEAALKAQPGKHPIHRSALDDVRLVPNYTMRNMIEGFLNSADMANLVKLAREERNRKKGGLTI